ncbi:MAG: hypothetical protein IJ328_04800 [Muribaculaceae bacterium]|nr:hypothetical protein [Muribaculaceae bacterium]
METVVFILMILVCFNFILKQTYRKVYSVAGISLICALFVGFAYPYAIEQSKSQISDWLANTQLMLDISVVLTVEVVIQMSFCMLAAYMQTAGEVKKRTLWAYRALRWFPGILIFPVLFSCLVAVIFSFPGVSFSLISWSLAAVVVLVIPLGSLFMKWLIPEKELRLELLFLCNALIGILGVIATVNGTTAVKGISEVDWAALAGLIALVIAGAAAGLVFRYVKIKKQFK